jgi:hypothetical protein
LCPDHAEREFSDQLLPPDNPLHNRRAVVAPIGPTVNPMYFRRFELCDSALGT